LSASRATTNLLTVDSWTLAASIESDIDQLMQWFADEKTVRHWGGPEFRYPYNRHSFTEDMQWGRMAAFSLRDAAGGLAAFGQLYERFDCINLARLIVQPTLRGQGVGRRLIAMLMQVGVTMFPCPKFSLFVYRDNTTASRCYRAMGFAIADYPQGVKSADVCDYLTRPVRGLEKSNAS
jgi:ribosomal protein S18 acetylase RimI-like enzyme